LLADHQEQTASVEEVLVRDEKLDRLIFSASVPNRPFPTDSAKFSVVKPEVTGVKSRLEDAESVPEFKCQIVRGGILGIKNRYTINRLHSRPSYFSKSIQKTDSFQDEEQEGIAKLFEPDLSSREPLCGTCQNVIRSYSKTEWHALVLSTKESLQKRASKGCPLCSLYIGLIAPYLNTTTAIASPTTRTEGLWASDEKSTTEISFQIAVQGHELVYKRDTGTKLVLLFLAKKYTVVLDWRYPSMNWSWLMSTTPSPYIGPLPPSENELLPSQSMCKKQGLLKC
jgi:hypothetical protein